MTITGYLPSVNTSAAYPAVVKALATPAGFEPATSNLEGSRSIQLSYGAVRASLYPQMPKAWKAGLFGSYPGRRHHRPETSRRDVEGAAIVDFGLRLVARQIR